MMIMHKDQLNTFLYSNIQKMFSKHETDKKNIFVNTIKVDKKKESKTTPNVNTKISAYDRVVQIVTNNDNNEIKPEEEAPPKKKVHMII